MSEVGNTGEPREEDLDPKPPVEEQLPEEGEDASDVDPQLVTESEFLSNEDAEADDTVDNTENLEENL